MSAVCICGGKGGERHSTHIQKNDSKPTLHLLRRRRRSRRRPPPAADLCPLAVGSGGGGRGEGGGGEEDALPHHIAVRGGQVLICVWLLGY